MAKDKFSAEDHTKFLAKKEKKRQLKEPHAIGNGIPAVKEELVKFAAAMGYEINWTN